MVLYVFTSFENLSRPPMTRRIEPKSPSAPTCRIESWAARQTAFPAALRCRRWTRWRTRWAKPATDPDASHISAGTWGSPAPWCTAQSTQKFICYDWKKAFQKEIPAGSWRALTAEGAFSTDTQNPYWKVPPMPVTKMMAIIVGHSSCGRAKVRERSLAGSTFLSQCCFVVSAS